MGCGSWLSPVFGSLVVVGSSVWVVVGCLGHGWVQCLGHGWVVAKVGCWSSEIASV